MRAKTSVSHVYVGEGAVAITAEINGGIAPYEVKIQAVKNGDVEFAESRMINETTASADFFLNTAVTMNWSPLFAMWSKIKCWTRFPWR